MNNYLSIIEEIKKNQEEAKSLEAKADNLLLLTERRNAATYGERKALRENITEADEQKAAELYNKVNELKNINKILSENANAAFCEYVTPIINNIMQKYNGKQYGEKTRAKIQEEAHKNGIGFYFDGYRERDTLKIYCMSPEGFKAYNMPEVTIYAIDQDGKRSFFISESNKINNFSIVGFSYHYKYTENPGEKRAEIIKKYEAFKKLVEMASKAESELNEMLPKEINRFNVIGYLSPHTQF